MLPVVRKQTVRAGTVIWWDDAVQRPVYRMEIIVTFNGVFFLDRARKTWAVPLFTTWGLPDFSGARA